jgi:hypothetical protein
MSGRWELKAAPANPASPVTPKKQGKTCLLLERAFEIGDGHSY